MTQPTRVARFRPDKHILTFHDKRKKRKRKIFLENLWIPLKRK
jgi:hypothetical protein